WDVRGKPRHVRAAGVDAGARKMAQGVGVFFRLLLEAVVMYLLAKGAGGVAQRLPQLVAQLRRSRLGAGFARWIEHNANSLIRDPRLNRDLRPKPQAGQGGAGSGGGSAQQPRPRQTQSERPPAAPAVRNGGAYKNVPARGGEVHHMPADSISPLSRGDGPGIRMETADHRRTASWGRSKAAQAYRAEQKRLIDQGRFREAIDMDVRDIRSKFGDKYDSAINEMMQYVDTIPPNKLPRPPGSSP
ncbi:MAG TPA: hypothetical protein VEQ42_04755, partial [Pyrinomonadaceae bacterium]|nr:hypothetical protein [Pyrinomonadaceae bacterium]